jgi:outer membrane protein
MTLSIGTKMKLDICLAVGALLASSALASAADLPSVKEPAPVAPVVEDVQPFFVKLGVSYAINTSYSRLYAQSPVALAQGVTQLFNIGVSATVANVTTPSVEVGYYFTKNISLNVAGGIPFYANVRTRGYNPANPRLPNGTLLAQAMPALIPITVVYHVKEFGAFQPYFGAGLTPVFSFAQKNGFLTNVKVGGAVGLVLQGGVDYMIDRHWGVSFDARKVFSYAEADASGFAVLPGVPIRSVFHENFQPLVLTAAVVYAFGAPNTAGVVARY